MSSSKNLSFAVVICHGHYHTPEPYQPFLAALKARGIEGYCPQLPTSDLSKMNVGDIFNPDYDRDPPPDGYPQPPQDVEVVHEILTKLIEEESKSVILIGHSAGGFVATAAAIPSLHAKNRRAKGESGGIAGNFYECAILVPVGESVYSFFQPDKDGSALVLSPFCEIHVRRTHIYIYIRDLQNPRNRLTTFNITETWLERRTVDQRGCKVLL